jgi:hypothetical protein
MAAALSSIGVAGLLIAAFMPGMLGSAAGPTREDFEAAHAPAASAPTEDSLGPLAGNPDASDKAVEADSSGAVAGAGGQVGGQSAAPAVRNGTDAGLDRPGTPSLLLVGSLGLLLVGLAMFGLRFAARRVR